MSPPLSFNALSLLFQSSGLCVQSPSIIPVPGILGQVWYLIVSIPDFFTLTLIIRVVLSVLRGGPKKSPRTFI